MAGYRAGIKRTGAGGANLPVSVGGAKARFVVPSSSNLNTAGLNGSNLYYFVNVNSANGVGNIDGGIVKRGDKSDKWYAFFSGTIGWMEKELTSQDGNTVEIKVTTTPYNAGGYTVGYYFTLYLNNSQTLQYYETFNQINPGPIACIHNEEIAQTTTEITVVPKNGVWSNFNNTNSNGQAFIKSGSFSDAYPLLRGGSSNYSSGDYTTMINCDTDLNSYPPAQRNIILNSVNSVCTVHSHGPRNMSSTIDINKAGNIF